ncbi:MAG: SRPBCC domain-containing protein [Acidimicrobiia bacterium]
MTQTTQTEQLVTAEIRKELPASVETVWHWFTDPDRLATWGVGRRYNHVTIDTDLRPGGVIHHRVTGKDDGTPWVFHGVYHEIDQPNRLSYTFDWKNDWREPPTPSLVDIEFTASGDGTEITLTHSQLPTEAVESTESHWNEFLDLLAQLIRDA